LSNAGSYTVPEMVVGEPPPQSTLHCSPGGQGTDPSPIIIIPLLVPPVPPSVLKPLLFPPLVKPLLFPPVPVLAVPLLLLLLPEPPSSPNPLLCGGLPHPVEELTTTTTATPKTAPSTDH
jgi:hypothetical protein